MSRDSVISGVFDAVDASQHITFKELKAVKIALEGLAPYLRNKSVALFSDSAATVSILKKLYTRSTRLRRLLSRIVNLI